MTVKITLTTAEVDAGPFDLYSNLDGFTAPFAVNVTKASLVAGYISNAVPNTTSVIRVKCKGTCTNYIDITCTTNAYPYELNYGTTCPIACNLASNRDFNL